MVTAHNPLTEHNITRNIAHYKKIPHNAPLPPIDIEEEEESDDIAVIPPNTYNTHNQPENTDHIDTPERVKVYPKRIRRHPSE